MLYTRFVDIIARSNSCHVRSCLTPSLALECACVACFVYGGDLPKSTGFGGKEEAILYCVDSSESKKGSGASYNGRINHVARAPREGGHLFGSDIALVGYASRWSHRKRLKETGNTSMLRRGSRSQVRYKVGCPLDRLFTVLPTRTFTKLSRFPDNT